MKAALLIVDVQRYYIEADSSFCAYSEQRWPGSTSYLRKRLTEVVLPSILKLRQAFDGEAWPTFYLRLCGTREDRTDLHRFFKKYWAEANEAGFENSYPLSSDPWSFVVDAIRPRSGDRTIDKTGFSGFNNTSLEAQLRACGVRVLVMTGLATSQCVDTTARAGSDRGFAVVHLPDAQVDYSEDLHLASLYASRGVCGANIVDTDTVCADLIGYIRKLGRTEFSEAGAAPS